MKRKWFAYVNLNVLKYITDNPHRSMIWFVWIKMSVIDFRDLMCIWLFLVSSYIVKAIFVCK